MKRLIRHPESRNKIKIFLVILVVAVVAAAGTCAYLAFFTNTCRITRIEITGNQDLTAEYVKQKSGVDGYKNLVTLPCGRLEKNLEIDPWIREAHVSRGFFHTVRINVEESKPVAMLQCKDKGMLVDSRGRVLAAKSLQEFKELPRVYGGSIKAPAPGQKVKDRKVSECISLIAAMPPSVQSVLQLANPFDGRGNVFISRPGYQVVYGPRTLEPQKNDVLQAIITDLSNNKRRASYVDVRVPDAPVIKLN